MQTTASDRPAGRITAISAMIAALVGTILGLAGTDLVLPAVPSLPDALGGTQAMAQGVLASYTFGIAIGLIVWGEAGSRFNQVTLLLFCLFGFALASGLATRASSLPTLSVLRFVQGFVGAAPAVFSPVWIRSLVPESAVVRVFGLLATFESMTPALAPIVGLWLLASFGWTSSFYLLFVLTLGAIILLLIIRGRAPTLTIMGQAGSYSSLLTNLVYWRYGLSQAASLAGLLIFVFGMPAVMVHVFELGVERFIMMQISGIFFFAVCANITGLITKRLGEETVIVFGSTLSAIAMLVMIIVHLAGVENVNAYIALFILVNAGLGLRAPPGFNRALAVSESNEARAAALVLLFAFIGTAAGTAITAPYVEHGLTELLAASFVVLTISPALLMLLPKGEA
ncbi:MAG: MFS transporter [Pseudomonadota bacterium]